MRHRLKRVVISEKAEREWSDNTLVFEFGGYEELPLSQIRAELLELFPYLQITNIRKFRMYKRVAHRVYASVVNAEKFVKWARE